MLPDQVLNPGSLTYGSGALPIALRGPAHSNQGSVLIQEETTKYLKLSLDGLTYFSIITFKWHTLVLSRLIYVCTVCVWFQFYLTVNLGDNLLFTFKVPITTAADDIHKMNPFSLFS